MLRCFTIISTLVAVHEATHPVDFSFQLTDEHSKLILMRHTRLDDAKVEEDGHMHVITADWLRERCSSDLCVDSDSQQPLFDPHLIEAVRIIDVQGITRFNSESGAENISSWKLLNDLYKAPDHINALRITFSDNTTSDFGVDFLLREIENHGPAPMQGPKVDMPAINVWNATLLAPPVFSYDDLTQSYMSNLVRQLFSTGIVVIDSAPQRKGFCSELGARMSTVRETEWGREFNVRTEPDTDQDVIKKDLAYTSKAIGLHTDNPYRDPMPDFQLLHQIDGCTCPQHTFPCATCRTDNLFVDGVDVAARLCEEDPVAFDLLSTINVRWENNGGNGEALVMSHKPIIEVDYNRMAEGACTKGKSGVELLQTKEGCRDIKQHIVAIRHSAKSGGYAPLLHPGVATKFYAARRKFSGMMASEESVVKVNLKPGQLVIFDNKRVLHARSAVISDRPRWLQGCYINRDGLLYELTKSISQAPVAPGWTAMEQATRYDFAAMGRMYTEEVDGTMVETMLAMLRSQKGRHLGQPVDLWQHNLQTASRALRAGEDVDTVIMSLFHDVTETVIANNHGAAAAAMLEPYLSPRAIWMLRHHEVFQGYYYFHYFGGDRNLRDRLYGNEDYYVDLVNWCQHYDQSSFDPAYPNLDMTVFIPMVQEVFSRQPFWWNLSHPNRAAVTGLRK